MRQAAEHAVQLPPGTRVETVGELQESMLCRQQSIQAQQWEMVAAAGNTMCHRTLQSRQCSANWASTAPPRLQPRQQLPRVRLVHGVHHTGGVQRPTCQMFDCERLAISASYDFAERACVTAVHCPARGTASQPDASIGNR